MQATLETELVSYRLVDDIAILRLERPEKRNAISDAVVERLSVLVQRAESEARAGVICGSGPHFSAGLDLSEHRGKSAPEALAGSRRWHEVFGRIERGGIPWIAALHGAVVGGGLELAASVHVRVAETTAFFGLPEGQRGIFVGGGGSVRVARLMGVARMSDMMLTGRTITADEAERWNLVQYVVPEGQAEARAMELARAIAANAGFSNMAVIHALPRIQEMGPDAGLFLESFVATFAGQTPEAAERLADFLDRRAARVKPPGAT